MARHNYTTWQFIGLALITVVATVALPLIILFGGGAVLYWLMSAFTYIIHFFEGLSDEAQLLLWLLIGCLAVAAIYNAGYHEGKNSKH